MRLLLLAALAATRVTARVIDHDKLQWQQPVASDLEFQWQPYLSVGLSVCVPYPAVDIEGNTSGGLEATGMPSSQCDRSIGQCYVRPRAGAKGRRQLMYAWYMPKDEPSPGRGHRHEFEFVILFLTWRNKRIKTCFSGPSSNIRCFTGNPWTRHTERWLSPGYHTLVHLGSPSALTGHRLSPDEDVGHGQPLVDWDSMEQPARNSLATNDRGGASMPMTDGNFAALLERAWDTEPTDWAVSGGGGAVDHSIDDDTPP